MRIFIVAVLALLVVSLAGLEVVMSSLPDEPITPAEVRAHGPDGQGYALPADAGALPLICDTAHTLASPAYREPVPGS
jgi:hypothetical protein